MILPISSKSISLRRSLLSLTTPKRLWRDEDDVLIKNPLAFEGTGLRAEEESCHIKKDVTSEKEN